MTPDHPMPRSEVLRRAVIIALHDMTYSSRVFKQADALHAAGFDVTLVGIVARSSDLREEQHHFGRVVRVRTTKRLHAERPVSASPSGGQPERTGSFLSGIRMFLGRMRDNYLLAKAARGIEPDVTIASDITAWAAGYLVKRWARVPLVLDMRDLVMDSGRNHPASYDWLLRKLERFALHRADAVTTVSPLFAEILADRFPAAPQPVAVYSGAFECVQDAAPVHEPMRLFFQGSFAKNRRLDDVVMAVAALRDENVTLSLQGFGEEEVRLRGLVSELDAVDRVEFVPPCAPRDVVACASQYDVGVIAYRGDTLNLRMTAPIKLLDYMAAGLAVVASDLPGLRHIVEAEQCGILFEPTGPEAIVDAVRELLQNPRAVAEMKASSVRACPKYSAHEQGKRFVEVVERVMGGETGSTMQ